MVTNLIYSKKHKRTRMLFEGFTLKIALKIVWNVWRIQALHTGREAFLTEKCTSIPAAHKYFGLETPKEVVTPSKQQFTCRSGQVLPEITAFISSPKLVFNSC